ncbi:MAG: hypothetical protein ABSA84_01595 [Gammaproteobacteria bacterium]|jgi:hypothetical protein
MQFKKYWLSFLVWSTEIKEYLLKVCAQLKKYLLAKYPTLLDTIKENLFKFFLLLIKNKELFKQLILKKLFRRIAKVKKYLFKRYILRLIEIKEFILKICIDFKGYLLRKLFGLIEKIKKYLFKWYLRFIQVKEVVLKRFIQIKEYLFGKLFEKLITIKKYSLKLFARLIEIKELLLKIFTWVLNIRKYLLNGSVLVLELGLLSVIFYAGKEFYSQIKITENIKTVQSELANTVLSLTNLLGKSTGNIDILEQGDQINVKPALYYSQQQKSHKLELTLLNPSYGFVDCAGDITANVSYPAKVILTWQPMQHSSELYELICERYSNSNSNSKASNKHKKVLLSNINAVKFKFLEYIDSNGISVVKGINAIKEIDPKKLQQNNQNINDIRIRAVQIGMLVQSQDKLYYNVRHNWYSIFNDHINFLDSCIHKVIYITVKSNLS